jgi:hypothetical protein
MKKAVKVWLDGLRSQKFTQGTDFLTRVNGDSGECDCCLGVAIKVCPKPPKGKLDEHGVVAYAGHEADLPASVQRYYGLRTSDGRFDQFDLELKHPNLMRRIRKTIRDAGVRVTGIFTLSMLNDNGVDYETIAEVIEAEPEGLFV